MKHSDEEVRSVSDVIKLLSSQVNSTTPVWYRGHADATWSLVPSVARTEEALNAEATLIKRFKQNALPFISRRPADEWEWLFLLQHYGVPTRLLDWSEAPLVALFFACEGSYDKDATLWCLLPTQLNVIANITPSHAMELPFLSSEDVLNNYLPSKVAQERFSNLSPAAVIAVRDSVRMYAQAGTFTVIHRTATPIESIGTQDHIWKWMIPKDSKRGILEELRRLNVTRLSLFPELSSVAQTAKEILA